GSTRISGDMMMRTIAAAIAGAEMNGQDVVISLSMGPSPMFDASDLQQLANYRNDAVRNALAAEAWLQSTKRILDVLAESEWARAGHVRLHKSAGNGALLCDAPAAGEGLCQDPRKVRERRGIDLTEAMAALEADPVYGPLMQNARFWCANNADGTAVASYSNHGSGIECRTPPRGLEGTSFAAPIGAGEDFIAVTQRLGGALVSLPTATPSPQAREETWSGSCTTVQPFHGVGCEEGARLDETVQFTFTFPSSLVAALREERSMEGHGPLRWRAVYDYHGYDPDCYSSPAIDEGEADIAVFVFSGQKMSFFTIGFIPTSISDNEISGDVTPPPSETAQGEFSGKTGSCVFRKQ
ncbi:MAG: hypothetical protein AB1626_00760, partial [Candidatus Micrarchaeota archaeon]